MERVLILVLCLTSVANGRTTLIQKRSLEFDQSRESTHEFQPETNYNIHEDIEKIEHQQYSDQGSVNLESNGHEGVTFQGEEGSHSVHSLSNQHLGVQHGYFLSHNFGNSAGGEEEKTIGHIDGFNNEESNNNEGKEISGGVSYQYVQTGDHPMIDNDSKGYNTFQDQEGIVEKYITHGEQESHEEITGSNDYGYQGTADHGAQYSFGNFLHHQEPEINEVTKVIPVHKTINIPQHHEVQKLLRIPVPVKVLEPFPIKIPIPYAVEKTVHVPVEKIIKYQVEKLVPVKVEKTVPVPFAKPYPVPFPVYKLKVIIHSGSMGHEE
ncbi:unnamed protein product [Nezara viridula]|uniref:Neuropeptide n=1 Tax=Nezara viridula TaxID=85310 RepID=A0A9P0H276_NEZVI|nr:unnamed protein product [Nezara viridula]